MNRGAFGKYFLFIIIGLSTLLMNIHTSSIDLYAEEIAAGEENLTTEDTTETETEKAVVINTEDLTTASQVGCDYALTGRTEDYTCTATPYEMHGKLSVSGTDIIDQYGNPVELRGVSLHGIQHTNGSTTAFKDYVNYSAFQILRDEWGVNLIRIPVYTAENGYCQGNAASMDTTIQNAVNYATQLGMYVIIDWHILSDGNPVTYQSQAISFFSKYSAMYQNYGNVIYEICNEPNGGVDWNTIKNYAKSVIPYIRANTPDALICVGTPQWSQRVDQAAADPITAGDINPALTGNAASAKADNILYSIHFYSATHYGDIQGYVTSAHNAGLPLFCTEFGICDASGNGNYDISNANTWINLLKSYNISFVCWNLSNNNESSAMFLNSCTKLNGWVNSDLNTTGAWFINTVRPMYLEEIANYSATPTTIYNGVDYSAVFDYDYYISKYPDIKAAYGTNARAAFMHFINCGMQEGRQASDNFNVTYYKNRYVDLRNAFGTDLKQYYLHYIQCGCSEGRDGKNYSDVVGSVTKLNGVDYSAVYNFSYYINRYSDIKRLYQNDDVGALQHFVNCGMQEGRQAIQSFNVTSYAYQYYDLRRVYKNDLKQYYLHYINCGKREGRVATGTTTMRGGNVTYNGVNYGAVYNVGYYANKYPDLRKAFGFDDDAYLQHFVNCGMQEGRQASNNFNVVYYKNRYVDLRNAFGTDLKQYYLHYIQCGRSEGRDGKNYSDVIGSVTKLNGVDYSAVYNFNYYINRYSDIRKIYQNDDIGALQHFVNFGMQEGRQASSNFNVFYYKNRYVDLQNAFGTDLKQYYLHYINCGKREGRKAV